jgi:ADP-heptose:LPS heptosyltransferase
MTDTNKNILFHHRGSLGDVIYSLPTIISFGGGTLYLKKEYHFQFLYNLLINQSFLNDVKVVTNTTWPEEFANNIFINLDQFRKIEKRKQGKHLSLCHLESFNKKYDLSSKWIDNIDTNYISDIIIQCSPRYHDKEKINWSILNKYKDKITFVGYKKEYKWFINRHNLNIPFYQCKDGLDFAQTIKGSKLFIGNQSFGFSVAEALKKPRILEVFYNNSNCIPNGKDGFIKLTDSIIEKYIND